MAQGSNLERPSGLRFGLEGGRSARHVCVEGLLDASAVDALVKGVNGAGEVVLDFLRAPQCSDATLGYLVERLSPVSATLRLTGLSQHQERLLGYLGASIRRTSEDPLDRDSGEYERLREPGLY